ncbi:MAG: histidinol-phosphatase [Azospirillum sp.]|nr:histidinol-phosphatase [Azospirillum sp.]
MTDSCPAHLATLAVRLADASGAVIRRYFRSPLAVTDKPDRSPVTVADREAESIIRAIIAAQRPEDGIVGEEYGVKGEDAEFLWVIDPIDGTKAFLTGRPTFVTLIGLLHRGRPILGVIDQPITGDRWIGAAGRATTLNGQPAKPRLCPAVELAILSTTSPDLFPEDDFPAFRRVSDAAKITVYGGDGYAYGLLASGFQDLVIEAGLKVYDFAALAPVVGGAGGVITDWQGEPLSLDSDGRVLAAGDPRSHAEALAMLANPNR